MYLHFSLHLFTFYPDPFNLTTLSLTYSLPSPFFCSLFPTHLLSFLSPSPGAHPSYSVPCASAMLFSTYGLLRGNVTPPLMLVHLWFYNGLSRLYSLPSSYTNPHTTIDAGDPQCFEKINGQTDRLLPSIWDGACYNIRGGEGNNMPWSLFISQYIHATTQPESSQVFY